MIQVEIELIQLRLKIETSDSYLEGYIWHPTAGELNGRTGGSPLQDKGKGEWCNGWRRKKGAKEGNGVPTEALWGPRFAADVRTRVFNLLWPIILQNHVPTKRFFHSVSCVLRHFRSFLPKSLHRRHLCAQNVGFFPKLLQRQQTLSRPLYHTWLIWWNFAYFIPTMSVWTLMFLSTLCLYAGYKHWAYQAVKGDSSGSKVTFFLNIIILIAWYSRSSSSLPTSSIRFVSSIIHSDSYSTGSSIAPAHS